MMKSDSIRLSVLTTIIVTVFHVARKRAGEPPVIARIVRPGVVAIALGLTIAGCGYRPLKAPCAPDEGQPLAFAPQAPLFSTERTTPMPPPLQALDPCGPMRPI